MSAGPPTVLLTRAREDSDKLAAGVRALGAQVLQLPCIAYEPLPFTAVHAQAAAQLPHTAAVVLASRKAVERFAALLHAHSVQLPAQTAVYAVGPTTQAAVEALLSRSARTASVWDAEHLLAQLLQDYGSAPRHFLLPAARDGRLLLRDGLTQAGHSACHLPVYQTVPAAAAAQRVTWAQPVHYILFTSPSCVQGFFAQAHLPAEAHILSIGPTTSAAVRAAGAAVRAQARSHDAAGLLTCLRQILENDDV